MPIKKSVSKKKVKKPVVSKKSVLKKRIVIKTKAVKRLMRPTKRLVEKLIASVVKSKPIKLVKLGKVIHYYNQIKVGIVKLSAPLSEGQKIQFKGATTDFFQVAKSIQINHAQVKKAKKDQIVGLKISKRVRQGDLMYKA